MQGKKRMRKELRRSRKGEKEGRRYREERRKYKILCEEKKRRERWLKEIEEVRSEGQVWKIINRTQLNELQALTTKHNDRRQKLIIVTDDKN